MHKCDWITNHIHDDLNQLRPDPLHSCHMNHDKRQSKLCKWLIPKEKRAQFSLPGLLTTEFDRFTDGTFWKDPPHPTPESTALTVWGRHTDFLPLPTSQAVLAQGLQAFSLDVAPPAHLLLLLTISQVNTCPLKTRNVSFLVVSAFNYTTCPSFSQHPMLFIFITLIHFCSK